MNERFIAKSTGGLYGFWGAGDTAGAAVANMRKAGAKKRDSYNLWRFYSELPFAPAGREATEQEADAWIGRDGSINWIRCEREQVQPAPSPGVGA